MATGISGSFTVMAAHMYPDLFGKLIFVNPVSPEKLSTVPTPTLKFAKSVMDWPDSRYFPLLYLQF